MEIPYLVSIIFGVLFLILFIIFVVAYIRLKKRDKARSELIEKTYLNGKPVRMDYDFVAYDDETEKLLARMQNENSQLTIDEVLTVSAPSVDDAVYVKMEKDEPEEITGNYKPE